MSKLMLQIIMSLGAVLLSTAPISQTFAQVKQQQEAQAGIAVADTLSNSSTSESDNLQLLRPDATTIFPKGDSIPVADFAAAMPAAAALNTGETVVIVVLVLAAVALIIFIIFMSTFEIFD